jgi:hypothetical protein
VVGKLKRDPAVRDTTPVVRAWAGGTFFLVLPLCQFFGCGGNVFLVLLPYIEYNT